MPTTRPHCCQNHSPNRRPGIRASPPTDIKSQQIADSISVFGTVEAMDRWSARIWAGRSRAVKDRSGIGNLPAD